MLVYNKCLSLKIIPNNHKRILIEIVAPCNILFPDYYINMVVNIIDNKVEIKISYETFKEKINLILNTLKIKRNEINILIHSINSLSI